MTAASRVDGTPSLGLGTRQNTDPRACRESDTSAPEVGYGDVLAGTERGLERRDESYLDPGEPALERIDGVDRRTRRVDPTFEPW